MSCWPCSEPAEIKALKSPLFEPETFAPWGSRLCPNHWRTMPDTPKSNPIGSAWTTMPAEKSWPRSEEHTSELQSPNNIVCRLLLAKKNHPVLLLGVGGGISTWSLCVVGSVVA